MWFESPCVKDTDFTNGAGAAKVFCPVPLLLLAIVLCLLGGPEVLLLQRCHNVATTKPARNSWARFDGGDSNACGQIHEGRKRFLVPVGLTLGNSNTQREGLSLGVAILRLESNERRKWRG